MKQELHPIWQYQQTIQVRISTHDWKLLLGFEGTLVSRILVYIHVATGALTPYLATFPSSCSHLGVHIFLVMKYISHKWSAKSCLATPRGNNYSNNVRLIFNVVWLNTHRMMVCSFVSLANPCTYACYVMDQYLSDDSSHRWVTVSLLSR